MRRTAVVALLVVALQSTSMAWGPIGHMAVAYLAYQRLTPAIKTRVRDLLKKNPDYSDWDKKIPATTSAEDHDMMIFVIASTWADDIKGDSKYSDDGPDPNTPDGATSSQNIGYTDLFRHRYWHFVDTPFSDDHTALPAIPIPNAQTQIDAFRAVLASTQSDDLKAYDLVWLLHLIGDVHQPLHASARVEAANPQGDAGGNKVTLAGDDSSNLHSYWDDLPGFDCFLCSNKVRCVDRAIVFAKAVKSPSARSAAKLQTSVWIKESFDSARTKVYRAPIAAGDGPYTIVPRSTYDSNSYQEAQRRIALAGARLAAVLNQELK